MKVMLLNPPSPKPMIREGRCQSPGSMRQTSIPQLSLACIGRLLKEQGADVDLVECMALDIKLDEVIKRLSGCGVVYLNTTTPTFENDMMVVRELKSASPDCIIGVFGTHVTVLHKQAIELNSSLDFVIRGEPEETALDIYERLNDGRSLEGSPGVTWREKDKVFVEEDRPFSMDLDRIAQPDRSLLPNEKYIHPISAKPYTIVNISRGCPGRCSFCVAHLYYGRRLRKRTIPSILEELKNMSADHAWFYADELTANKKFLRELCEGIISEGIKIRWWSNSRADVLDQDLYDLMARSGCFMLSIGGESGSQEILDKACKRIKLEDIAVTVKMLKKSGIISLVYFLFGLSGETKKTIKQTMDFTRKIGADYVEFYPATPYPGTMFQTNAAEEGRIAVDDFNKYECGGSGFVVSVDGFEEGELEAALQKAYRRYYFRPGYLPILLRRLRSPGEFARLLKFGLGYFRRFSASNK